MTSVMAGTNDKVKPYVPWYKANKNKHILTEERLDIDLKGNRYILTVYISENKKGEIVEDIIRVIHLGPGTTDLSYKLHIR